MSVAVQPPMPPEPVADTPPPAVTQPVATGAHLYISTQGDAWDMIAMRVYGLKRGNEHLMYRLLEENYPLRELSIFPGGVAVTVPDVNIQTDIELVPWKLASILP